MQSFEDIKTKLANVSTLSHPVTNATHYHLVTDSSSYAIGAALHQIQEDNPVPIGFYSKKLSEAQRTLSTFDRELLAAYQAVLQFKSQIEGRHVTLFTDHKPLVSAYKKPSLMKSDKQQRHMSLISEYIADVLYIRGNDNIVADCLSRPTNAVSVDIFDLPAIAEQQKEDTEIQDYADKLVPYSFGNSQILCEKSTPSPRPFIPKASRKSIFDMFHKISHSGINATLKLIKQRYYWPNMDKEIRNLVKECQECQQSKIHRHTKSEVMHFNIPSARFQTIHVDIVGPLPPATPENCTYPSSYRYILTCIDRSTRWIEAIPMADISASTVAISFLTGWISRFGVPLHVVTDRGSQFESELFQELSKLIGFHRLRTTSYHPQSNGLIERQHRTIKTAIMARKQNWLTALPIVLLGLRNIPTENGYSPSVAVTGESLLLPRITIDCNNETDFSNPKIQEFAAEMKKLSLHQFSDGTFHSNPKPYVPKDLKKCSHVWLRVDRVRRPLEAPYCGPFKVISKQTKFFTIETNSGQSQNVSIDRLKPVHPDTTPQSTEEPSSQPSQEENDDEDTSEHESLPSDPSTEHEEPLQEQPALKTRSGRTIKFKNSNEYFYF